MNQIEAFKDTIREAVASGMEDDRRAHTHPFSFSHLQDMIARAEGAEAVGEPYSAAKLGRHLGWAQCVVAFHQVFGSSEELTEQADPEIALTFMKKINEKWRDDPEASEFGWLCWNEGPGAMFWSATRAPLVHELSSDICRATALEKALMERFGKPTPSGGFMLEPPPKNVTEADLVEHSAQFVTDRLMKTGLGLLSDRPMSDEERVNIRRIVHEAVANGLKDAAKDAKEQGLLR